MAASPGRSRGHGIADDQAALRRVAVVAARAAPPGEVFAAVTEEVGRLLGAGHAAMSRYDPDGAVRVVAAWSSTGAAVPVGTRVGVGGRNVHTLVFRTGRAARLDDYAGVSGAAADVAREFGFRAAVGAPISVEGRLWGVIAVASAHEQPLPADTEARLAGFTELAATAIANAQARVELRGFAEEQAALRRVATLVARAAPPQELFAAVTAEVGRVLSADGTIMSRYEPEDAATVVGVWSSTAVTAPARSAADSSSVGGIHTLVFQTARSARTDLAEASGTVTGVFGELGLRSCAGVPISVAGRLWGVMIVVSTRDEPLPADIEARLAGFTELAATAIANAEAQAALTASRARIVAAADQARRRIERDLHDGAQQRLVSLALQLRGVQADVPPGAGELAQRLEGVVTEVTGVLEELRELARGLHPAVLSESGLGPALRVLARRSAVPVSVDVQVAGRLPEPVETAAYYVVSEALTNAAKHAHASAAEVEVAVGDGVLQVCVRDDGSGGADFGHGSGLVGLKDRIEALGGRIWLHSPPGAGTVVQIVLPVDDPISA